MVVAGRRRRSTVRSTQHAWGKLGTKGRPRTKGGCARDKQQDVA